MRHAFLPFALSVATLFASLPANAQAMRLNGWWIVLNSIRDDGSQVPHRQMMTFMQRMKRDCGIEIFNDASAKFSGFAPGLLVATMPGAYASEAAAQQALTQVRTCVPGAYIKRARHGGE